MSTRAGSHAGRGFRFQDAVGSWLAIRCWLNPDRFGGVIPEGYDDLDLQGVAGLAFVQVKSRRDGLGLFPVALIENFVLQLWDRYEVAAEKPVKLWLVVERGINGLSLDASQMDDGVVLTPHDVIGAALSGDVRAAKLLPLTHISIINQPAQRAVTDLQSRLGVTPMVANVCFRELLGHIGQLADDNGVRDPSSYLSLSASDVQSRLDMLVGVLSTEDLDSAIREGLCEAVDFLTPLFDGDFYLGVDTQAGHVVAGLLAERPDSRMRVLEALERRRNTLIAGPSGAGKSALMWEVAHASRHTVRWFRMTGARIEHLPRLTRLADAFKASSYAPVGFIIDDVGRSRADLWDAVARTAAARPGVLVLGSIREEDVFLLTELSRAMVLREPATEDLAERLWRELSDRAQTTWAGWREAWIQSEGLLLEYAHILTRGARLRDVLGLQVDERQRNNRTLELAVIRIASVAGRAGAILDLSRTQAVLGCDSAALSSALKRLVNEHVLQEINSGEIGSLHQLRATVLFEASHETPPPRPSETIEMALRSVVDRDLEVFTAFVGEQYPELEALVLDVLAARLRVRPDLAALTSALRGLDSGSIRSAVRGWVTDIAQKRTVPRTQVTMAAMFAMTDMGGLWPEKLGPLYAAADELRALMQHNPRALLLNKLKSDLPLFLNATSLGRLAELLAALSGSPLSDEFTAVLETLHLDLLHEDLGSVEKLLESLHHVAPATAKRWVECVGQQKLLDRVLHETPWAINVGLTSASDGRMVSGDHCVIIDNESVNDEVVALCRRLLAVAPEADIAACRALDPNGDLASFGEHALADKRIPRPNLPPHALPTRNRRWINAAAQCVGAGSKTEFLDEAATLLRTLLPLLMEFVVKLMRGQLDNQALQKIGIIHERSKLLVTPHDMGGDSSLTAIGVSDLQHVLFYCSADLIRQLAKLPQDAMLFVMNATQMLERISKASAEPWSLLNNPPTAELQKLRTFFEDLRDIADEASARGKPPLQLFGGILGKVRAGSAITRLAAEARKSIHKHVDGICVQMQMSARALGYDASVHARSAESITSQRPYFDAVVIVRLADITDWPGAAATLIGPVRAAAGEGRSVALIPAVGAVGVPSLCHRGVGQMLPIAFDDKAYLQSIGVPCVTERRVRVFDDLTDALATLSAMFGLGLGTAQRAAAERETREALVARIRIAQSNLDTFITDRDLQNQISRLVDGVTSGEIPLARIALQAIHGQEMSEIVLALSATRLRLISDDISDNP